MHERFVLLLIARLVSLLPNILIRYLQSVKHLKTSQVRGIINLIRSWVHLSLCTIRTITTKAVFGRFMAFTDLFFNNLSFKDTHAR